MILARTLARASWRVAPRALTANGSALGPIAVAFDSLDQNWDLHEPTSALRGFRAIVANDEVTNASFASARSES